MRQLSYELTPEPNSNPVIHLVEQILRKFLAQGRVGVEECRQHVETVWDFRNALYKLGQIFAHLKK